MQFSIPMKYLLNETTGQLVDIDLWKAICEDMCCAREASIEQNLFITQDVFLEWVSTYFPEGEQEIENDIFCVSVWDDYNYGSYYTMEYCLKNEIPINSIQRPDNSDECRFYEYYRPGFKGKRFIDANDNDSPVIPIHTIVDMMNEADESVTDTEVMLGISKYLDEINPLSDINKLQNWR